jgi:hypothetical protein
MSEGTMQEEKSRLIRGFFYKSILASILIGLTIFFTETPVDEIAFTIILVVLGISIFVPLQRFKKKHLQQPSGK